MRLLFITETHPPDRGGMAESCDRIVRGLARAGVSLDLVHFDRRCVSASHRMTSSGSLTRVPPDADVPHALNLLWNRLQQTVDLRAITHVVAFGGSLPLLAAPVFAAWIERPLVTLLRGNELDLGIFDPRRRSVLDDALRRSVAVCTVTTSHARKVAALHPDIAPHVVPNGIDFALWQPTDADRARAASWRETHVETTRRVLGLFGHLKSKKGVPFFLDSLRRSGHADRFHLLLIGEVEEQVQALLDSGAFAFDVLAPVDRFALLPFYLACDLVVVPSHYDGFPNVVIEAMALGRPLLASKVGGVEDVVTNDEGFLFAPGDDSTCRDAIARAAEASDETLQRMGERALSVAQRRCDSRDEAKRYLDVLEAAQEVFHAHETDDRSDADAAPRRLWRAR